MSESGIYAIVHIATSRRYIGSSVDLDRRQCEHLSGLRKMLHPNRHLQFAWNKYGAETFRFEILEFCHVDQLLIREQYYLDERAEFNIAPESASQLGFRHSSETKAKMSAANKLRMSDSAYKTKVLASLNTPEAHAKIGIATKKYFKEHPEARERQSHAAKVQWNDPETREKMSALMKLRMSDPIFKEKVIASHTKPEALAKIGSAAKIRMNNAVYKKKVTAVMHTPEARAKSLASRTCRLGEPEVRAKIGAASKRRWGDPAFRAKVMASRSTPEVREKQSVANKRQMSDPKALLKFREAGKRCWSDPAFKEKIQSAANRPEAKAKRQATRRATMIERGHWKVTETP